MSRSRNTALFAAALAVTTAAVAYDHAENGVPTPAPAAASAPAAGGVAPCAAGAAPCAAATPCAA
ncbi:MAG: hypothetical protein JJ926_15860, partial [Roseitalea sp.]|nr:hypothetical protein [Roseitalea sp.]